MSALNKVKQLASALDLSAESKPDIIERLDNIDKRLEVVASAIEQLQQVQTNVHTTLRNLQAELSNVRGTRRQ